jgi:uncharacterized membrane-anchored protein YjiN (DUF445 family)
MLGRPPAPQGGAYPPPLSREKAAEIMCVRRHELETLLRRRLRHKLLATEAEDIVSSAFRRVDRMMHRGETWAATEEQLMALVRRVAEYILRDAARRERSRPRLERGDALDDCARNETDPSEAAAARDLMHRVLHSETLETEAQFLTEHFREHTRTSISRPSAAARQRLSRLLRALRRRVVGGGGGRP